MYDTDAIRRDHPIADVAAASGLELRPTGGRLVAVCPLHGDTRPSFVIYPSSQSFYCFGCGVGGDVLDFVSRLHRLDFKEAAALLQGSRLPTPARATPRPSPARRPAIDPAVAAAIVETAVAFYEAAIWTQPKALAYLASRGVERATVRRYRLGFGIRGLVDELRRQDLDVEAAEHLGLLNEDRERFVGRVIVPNLVGGRPTWFTGRRLDDREPRYLNIRLPKPILGLASVKGEAVVVTEGPFDWLISAGWGFWSVALLGTHLSQSSAALLERFDEIFLVLDADGAGREATREWCDRLGDRAIPVALPPGVSDLSALGYQPDGRQVFTRLVLRAGADTRHMRQRAA
jgi:DNA primase